MLHKSAANRPDERFFNLQICKTDYKLIGQTLLMKYSDTGHNITSLQTWFRFFTYFYQESIYTYASKNPGLNSMGNISHGPCILPSMITSPIKPTKENKCFNIMISKTIYNAVILNPSF